MKNYQKSLLQGQMTAHISMQPFKGLIGRSIVGDIVYFTLQT